MITVVPTLIVLSLGTVILFSYWSLWLRKLMYYARVSSIEEATHLLIISTRNQKEIVELKKGSVFIPNFSPRQYFEN